MKKSLLHSGEVMDKYCCDASCCWMQEPVPCGY